MNYLLGIIGKSRLILAVFCFFNAGVLAQPVSFRQLSINDGLSQNAVFSIIQDQKGFMWFGTKDGLNRYDGYTFKVYQHNPFDTTTISANYITQLFEDSRGLLWAGTLNGGLNFYSRENDTFRRISFNVENLPDFNEPEVRSLTEDAQGHIWAGTRNGGLFQLSIQKNYEVEIKHFFSDSTVTGSLKGNTVSALYTDSNRILWVATNEGLNRFVPEKELFVFYKINTRHAQAPEDKLQKNVTSILEGSDGTFWLGTLAGLVQFDRLTGNYELFPHQYDLFRYGWGLIVKMVEDSSGLFWLATPGGLMRFSPVSNNYEYFKHDPFDPNSISDNTISSLCLDKTGILWVGTSGLGINIYNKHAVRFSTLKREKNASSRVTGFSIRSVLEDREGNVWIGSDVLFRWDRKIDELISYETNSYNPDDFGNVGPWKIIQSSDGIIWMASNEGLFRYNPANQDVRQFKFNPDNTNSMPEKDVFCVFEDLKGQIWIITENYLCKLSDQQKGTFGRPVHLGLPSFNEPARAVIYQDNDSIFWIGTREGLIRFEEKTERLYSYKNIPDNSNSLSNNLVKSISPDPSDPEKFLWIGTAGGGLNLFNKKEGTFTHFTENDGLPNNVVYGILPDNEGNLWLSTNKGLSRFNPQTVTFRSFDIKDGLQSNEFNTGAFYGAKSGELFFGGINGLNYFFPDEIADNLFKPQIVITSIKVEDKEINPKSSPAYLGKTVSEAERINLTHKDNIVTFNFAALDFSAPEKNQYAYMLENYNDAWINAGTINTATYTNLPPGDYFFRVKASNNDGIWNEDGAGIAVIVRPPWWQTSWARGFYGVSLFFLLLFLRKYERKRIHLKNQLHLEKMELESLRKIDQVKSRFFANISHEFRTPLTLILGNTENLFSEKNTPQEKRKLQVIKQNAAKLLKLINQLLDLSKIDAGNMELKREEINIVSFLKGIFFSFESLALQKNIEFTFFSTHEKIVYSCEPEKIELIMLNILSNAFKFTEANGKINMNVNLQENNDIQISISDTGIGIPQDQLIYVFDRFYQADNSSIRKHEGTGIGLALAKELTELHEGFIEVNSEPGKGAEFKLTLPGKFTLSNLLNSVSGLSGNLKIRKKLLHNNFENESPVPLESSADSQDKSEIIMVVEDNLEIQFFLGEILHNQYKIIFADDGQEGLLKAQNEVPDLIITDVMMPRMDGYQFCKQIKNNEKTSHIPIVMLTAKAGPNDKLDGLETGADAFLTKPFNPRELKLMIKNLLKQRERFRKQFSKTIYLQPSKIKGTSIEQVFLQKTITIIETHFSDYRFSVERLAEQLNMSVSQLNRKLNVLIDQPAGQLIRSLRLKRAADLLKQNSATVSEICYNLGFNDLSYFSRAFKKQFGCTPTEYKDLEKTAKP